MNTLDDLAVASDDSRTEISRERPRARVVRHVRECLADGRLGDGAVLPSAQELAHTLEVDRRTVRSALEMLCEQGVIHLQRGRFHVVVAPPPRGREVGGALRHAIVLLSPSRPELAARGGLDSMSAGASAQIESAGLHLLRLHPDSLDDAEIKRLVAARPFGVALTDLFGQPPAALRLVQALDRAGVPVAAYGGWPQLARYDCVLSGHQDGAYQLTRWLLARGHKRILEVWPEPPVGYWYEQRHAGYERAMREAGLQVLEPATAPLRGGADSRQEWSRAARAVAAELIEHLSGADRVEALLVHTDPAVPIVASACRLFKLEPNRDVALVGYDNQLESPAAQWEAARPLATVDKHNSECGRALIQLLLERAEGKLGPEPQRRVIAPQLVEPRTEPEA